MTLEVDYTQPTFDSYLDLDATRTRLGVLDGSRSEEGWIQTPEARKEAFLRQATLWVRDYARYLGAQVDAITGGIAVWPRLGVYYPNGTEVASDSVPSFVLDATLHRALDYADGLGLPQTEELESAGDTEVLQIGTLKIQGRQSSQSRSRASLNASQEKQSYAAWLLSPYVYSIARGELRRG